MRRADKIWAVGLGCFAIVLLEVTYQAQEEMRAGIEGMLWPQMILWGLLFLCLVLLARSLVQGASKNADVGITASRKPLMQSGLVALVSALYIGLLNIGGFLLTTLVFSGIAMKVLNRNRIAEITLGPLALTGVLYLLFIVLLNVPLPRGRGLFRELSLLFY